MMASNMSEWEVGVYDVDDDEEVIVPRPHYYSIWDCPHINKFTLEENGVVKNGWRCNWCMNPTAMLVAFSATKALAHVLWLPGSNVRPCAGIIPAMLVASAKSGAMWAASAGVRLAAASENANKHGVFVYHLVQPHVFLQNNRSHPISFSSASTRGNYGGMANLLPW